MGLGKYITRKALWYLGAMVVAVILNFLLPRLMPGNPVDTIVSNLGRGGTQGEALTKIYEAYVHEFGLDQPMWQQFFTYLGNLFQGDLGTSFSQYPASVEGLISQALPWSIALQLPAVIIGWLVGNVIGAVAAYKGGFADRGAFLASLFFSQMPQFCLAILLLYLFAVYIPYLPASGAYSFGVTPELSVAFMVDVMQHYWLPFLSLVIIFVGGQAVGMRSMAIYELGSDYVNYSRGLGLPDSRIVRYIFRNASLPQVSGLGVAIGAVVGGALITEIVFSYPGIGSLLFGAINQKDYPVVQAVTLLILVFVLVANFLIDVTYGFVDPRIRAAQEGER
jgi:peptide/nickel transport system permease protein